MKEEIFNLTKSQEELAEKMEAFLNGPDKMFRLIGKPGVGKTTMTKILLKEHIEADRKSNPPNINVAGISLSHQAKNVLGEHIPHVFTFAKAYGMKEHIDKITGKRTFVHDKYAQKGTKVGTCDIPVFVHDEVSQYTQEMLDIVFDKTPMFSKIIFMGDRAQLPPIDPDNKMGADADSPIFSIDFPENCQHELTERVRQAEGNPILELSDIIREEIFGNQDVNRILKIISKPKMKDGIGYSFVNYSNFLEHLTSNNEDLMDTKLIAFRNKTIDYFNQEIRDSVLCSPENILTTDDIICMRDNFHRKDNFDMNMYVLFNSEVFRLGDIRTSFLKANVDGKNYKVECYYCDIQGRKEQFIAPTEAGLIQYQKACDDIERRCKEREVNWKQFYEYREKFCFYMYGYAITAYKAQGSTYKSVYLDINDVLLTGPLTPKRKLQTIYTAITRAKNDVYFLKKG